jgi:hypothetical protein
MNSGFKAGIRRDKDVGRIFIVNYGPVVVGLFVSTRSYPQAEARLLFTVMFGFTYKLCYLVSVILLFLNNVCHFLSSIV